MLSQSSLNFSVALSPSIPGLKIVPRYISASEMVDLLDIIDTQPWMHDLKRRVQHYGYRYDYKARGVSKNARLGELPSWILPLCERLHSDGIFQSFPDQVIVNEYQPGQGISAHTDCIPCFGETIASLSLGSTCVMDFTHAKAEEKISILLEAGGLLILTGDARYTWRHAIAGRKTDRYNGSIIHRSRRVSLTFRNVVLD